MSNVSKPILEEPVVVESDLESSPSMSSSGSSSGDSSSGSSSSGDSDSSSESSSGEDSDEESEEEVSERPAERKRRKGRAETDSSKRKRFRFLDVEADVGSSDEEDEEYYDEETMAAAREGGGRGESRELELLRKEAEQRRKTGGSNRLQSVIQRLEERAAREKQASNGEEEIHGTSAIVPRVDDIGNGESTAIQPTEFESALEASNALFPSVDDYKLFFVRMAEPGKEKEAVIQLSHKAASEMAAWEESGQRTADYPIRSVFSVDSVRGYIYIEAPNDTVARNFLSGIRKVQWYSKIVVVPTNEMASVFRTALEEASAKFKPLNVGEYVRIKRPALYKGDLAKVVDATSFDRYVQVAVVPRIDWASLSHEESTTATKTVRRPNQTLFDPQVVTSMVGGSREVERLRNPTTGQVHTHFRGEMYTDDGLLIKRVSRSALVVGDELVHPSLQELRRFGKSGGTSTDMAVAADKGSDDHQLFAIGDSIVVKFGDLKNLIATITLINKKDGIITVSSPASVGVAGTTIDFHAKEIEKHFNVSDHVVIVGGHTAAGDTGLVTSVDRKNSSSYTVLIDGETREVVCGANFLRLCKDVSTGEVTAHGYRLGDLVEVRKSIVGIVVKISNSGHITIIDTHGKKQSFHVSEISGKKDAKNAFAISRHGDQIRKGCVVKVALGTASNGTVAEVYRNTVFVKLANKSEDGGLIGVDAKLVELVGTSGSTSMSSAGRMGPHVAAPQTGYGSFGGGSYGAPSAGTNSTSTAPAKRGPYRTRLEGKRVRIIKGTHKGQLAEVREDLDTKVQVALVSKYKLVTVSKDCVRLEDESNETAATGDQNYHAEENFEDFGDHDATAGDINNPPVYVPPASTPYTPAPWGAH